MMAIIILPTLLVLRKLGVERSTIKLFIYSAAIIYIVIFVIVFVIFCYRMIQADRAVKNLKAKASKYEQYIKSLDKK